MQRSTLKNDSTTQAMRPLGFVKASKPAALESHLPDIHAPFAMKHAALSEVQAQGAQAARVESPSREKMLLRRLKVLEAEKLQATSDVNALKHIVMQMTEEKTRIGFAFDTMKEERDYLYSLLTPAQLANVAMRTSGRPSVIAPSPDRLFSGNLKPSTIGLSKLAEPSTASIATPQLDLNTRLTLRPVSSDGKILPTHR